ncbi:long-chain-acyl-CoA synthetase [Pseudidiomarina sp. 1ASP75-14]|uniref:long-chain-acyl-CoA synthetase n=1 Tax=Pseudidiomarina terrestris TaxID=2820060 RepID=UPI00264F8D47|nr:long-chain-acyl-CoA synthetase [Pseudidiomarina sp. 1ASP75-14]MDN7138579.1 long-chain-acyl-CoA synthetase [Pseudidiomarina sp. 1ASP75-14]
MAKTKPTFSFFDLGGAFIRFVPRLPRFFVTLLQIARAKKHQRGSTGYFLQRAAARHPERVFLKVADPASEIAIKTYTYFEFNRWVNQLAHALHAYGIERGDCVGLLFRNSPEQLAWAFALNKLGAVAGMLNHKQRGEQLLHSINVIQPRLLIAAAEFAPQLGEIEVELPTSCQLSLTPDADLTATTARYIAINSLIDPRRDENPEQTASLPLGDNCFYVLTSGTAGLPKAAAMTHLRWYKAGIGFGSMAMGLKTDDTLYNSLPLYHNTALSIALSSVILNGSSLALSDRFSASQFWGEIKRFNATCFVYVGELCRYLLQQPAHAEDASNPVRGVIGNGLRAELWDEFQERFAIPRICELYGASEGNVAFVNAFNLKRTVGFSPMTYAVVQFDFENETPLRDANGRLGRVAKGEVGLLLTEVSDRAPFDGYTHNEAANRAKLCNDVFAAGDCWFNTGDLVRHQGYRHIAFVDRVGDTFRWKSENVATTEVEAQITTFADVIEAVVYGVKVPHTEGRAGMVSVILQQGREFNPSAFYQHLKSKLPDYALPRFVRLRDSHDVTTTFKVKKSQLKKESFSLSDISDRLYVLVDPNQGYQPLDEQIYGLIHSGKLRL